MSHTRIHVVVNSEYQCSDNKPDIEHLYMCMLCYSP